MTKTKTLFIDLEMSPTLGWTYGQYNVNVIRVEQAPTLLSFSWKFENEPIQSLSLIDVKSKNPFDHTALVKQLHKIMSEAGVIVAHNADFDVKMANTLFVKQELEVPTGYKIIDTLKEAKKHYKFENNTLDYLAETNLGKNKLPVGNGKLWYTVMFGKGLEREKASVALKEYNEQDVLLLEELYYKLTPNKPKNEFDPVNMTATCPKCGTKGKVWVNSYRGGKGRLQLRAKECQHLFEVGLPEEWKKPIEKYGFRKCIYRLIDK